MATATTTAGLNLRTGAGTGHQIMAVIPADTTITIAGEPWYPVTYGGQSGWVSGRYIRLTPGDTQTPHDDFAADAMAVAVSKLGSLYRWGGNGPDRFDCSGFVGWVLHSMGYQPGNNALYHYSAGSMFHSYRTGVWPAQRIEPGYEQAMDLVFYGPRPDHAGHVVFATGDGRVIGASGGGSTTLTDAEAQRRGAKVRYDTLRYHSNPIIGIYRPAYRSE